MQNMKKCISVLLALVMLASVFVFSVSAGVSDLDASASQNIAMKLEIEHEDGTAATTVNPGETIVAKLYVTAKDAEARIAGGAIAMFYNSDVYTFVSRTFGLESIDPNSLMANNNTDAFYTNTVKKFTAAESAMGWNCGLNIQIKNAAGYSNTNASLIKENAATPFLTVVFTVNDNVAPNTAAPIGIPETSVAPLNTTRQNYTYIQTYTAANKTIVQNKSKSLYVLDTIADDLVVVPATEPSIVNPLKGQIRFQKDGNGAYAGKFDVRALAAISNEDFVATFGNVANAKAKISEIGFVFATGANVAAPSMDAVKALVENGTAAAGYAKKTVNYISTSVEAGNYVFSCIVTDITDNTQSLVAVGYIAYTNDAGETVYAYYPTAQTISFSELYTGYYGQAFPQA